MRVRAFPFPGSVRAFVEAHDTTFVVEQNRDGQLRSLLINEAGVEPGALVPVLLYGGLPLSAGQVVERVLDHLGLVAVGDTTVSAEPGGPRGSARSRVAHPPNQRETA